MTRFLVLLSVFGALVGASGASRAQDASDMVVRLNRVEGQMRQMSGQVEQLQFENKQLKEQLRKFQEDVEFRLQERGGRAASPPPAAPRQERPAKRSDAFDPSAEPNAVGAPRPLGPTSSAPPRTAGVAPSVPEGRRDPIAGIIDDENEDVPKARRPLDLGAAARQAPSVEVPRGGPVAEVPPQCGPSVASTGTGDARADYDIAYAYLMQRQYDRAEMSFRGFLQSHPRDRLAPDATYWLGESYLQRSRPREAAEQFLKVSTEFSRSTKAPDALLKLGVSLAALGAKDQACATFAELERKYPTASPSIKQGVDREQKRVRCSA